MKIDPSTRAISTKHGSLGVKECAQGVVGIAKQGYDPREFALMSFGGGGSMHANAVIRTMGCWPVIIPPSPGVLCAYGDATTRLHAETSKSFIHCFKDTSVGELTKLLTGLGNKARPLTTQH